MRFKEVLVPIFVTLIINTDGAENDAVAQSRSEPVSYGRKKATPEVKTELGTSNEPDVKSAEWEKCMRDPCMIGTVETTILESSNNELFKVEGEPPNVTLTLPQGFNFDNSNKYVGWYYSTPDNPTPRWFKGNLGNQCLLLRSYRKGRNSHLLADKLMGILFAGYEGCEDEPKTYLVSPGILRSFCFDGRAPSRKEFEMEIRISETSESKTPELTFVVRVVPDNVLSCMPKGVTTSEPTVPQVTTLPTTGSEPGSPDPQTTSSPDPATTTTPEVETEPETSTKPNITDEEWKKCMRDRCMIGTVETTILESSNNELFKVEGEPPNVTLTLPQGFNFDNSNKYVGWYYSTPDNPTPRWFKGNLGNQCLLLRSYRKGRNSHLLANKLMGILFAGYEGCEDEPKTYRVSPESLGSFCFERRAPSRKEFEMEIRISETSESKTPELTFVVRVVPDNVRSCMPKEVTTSEPTVPQVTTLPTTASEPGSPDPQTTSSLDPQTTTIGETEPEISTGPVTTVGESNPTEDPCTTRCTIGIKTSSCNHFRWLRNYPTYLPNATDYIKWLKINGCITAPGSDPGPSKQPKCDYFKWLRNYPEYYPNVRVFWNWLKSNGCLSVADGKINGEKVDENESGNRSCNYYKWYAEYPTPIPNVTDFYMWLNNNKCLPVGKVQMVPVKPDPKKCGKNRERIDNNNKLDCNYFKLIGRYSDYIPKVTGYMNWIKMHNCPYDLKYAILSGDEDKKNPKCTFLQCLIRPLKRLITLDVKLTTN